MSTIEEKRVYGNRANATVVYVASGAGVLRVRVANDLVGEFSLCERGTTRDVATDGDRIAAATDEDVLVADADDRFEETGFGPAVAVGYDGGTLLAAGGDGRVARRTDGDWETLRSDPSLEVRAIDGGLVGTAGGVYRLHDGGLDHAGLTDVRDVSAPGVPLAATADGLYKLGNGWMQVLEEPVETVAADPASDSGELRRAHAVAGLDLYGYADGDWRAVDRSSVPIVGVAYGEGLYAVTDRGTMLVAADADEGDGLEWRSRRLGVGSVTGIAVPRLRRDGA
ncbi:HVO_0234 family beta-propeller protein [Natrononativus amylolyticus]|uniref:HVO_0234 family beta-propeller protein n=1 Tax=Natrononativus amylolyticus TaxID=2963434 RepID=UPI0020CDF500|nr:hypothetical protein [Natrononativus amylolyticus]